MDDVEVSTPLSTTLLEEHLRRRDVERFGWEDLRQCVTMLCGQLDDQIDVVRGAGLSVERRRNAAGHQIVAR